METIMSDQFDPPPPFLLIDKLEQRDAVAKRAACTIPAALHQLTSELDGNDYGEPGFKFEMVWVFMANEDEDTAQLFRDTCDWEAWP
jgi:hypothetical protein